MSVYKLWRSKAFRCTATPARTSDYSDKLQCLVGGLSPGALWPCCRTAICACQAPSTVATRAPGGAGDAGERGALQLLAGQAAALESLLQCMQRGWMCLLVGAPGSGAAAPPARPPRLPARRAPRARGRWHRSAHPAPVGLATPRPEGVCLRACMPAAQALHPSACSALWLTTQRRVS